MNSVLNEANLYTGDNSAEYIPENELPFERTKIVLDDEDEDYEGSVRASMYNCKLRIGGC